MASPVAAGAATPGMASPVAEAVETAEADLEGAAEAIETAVTDEEAATAEP
jgi:hypothetical protein